MSRVPPAPLRSFNQTIDLERLQKIAEALALDEIPNDPNAEQVQDLLLLGTSIGGAGPKAVIQDGESLWIVKFAGSGDRWNFPRVEHAMLELARQCGIHAAESRIETIAGKDVLLIKRFDRQKTPDGYTRSRMISGLTALHADEAPTTRERWSYVLLAEELHRIVSDPKAGALELFRRMCFNALTSNTDDHPRNHAFLCPDRNWSLSPAYDLTPSPVVSLDRRDLALECGDQGRFANATNILSQHRRFLLEREEAEKVIYGMRDQVEKTWRTTALACGVSTKDAESIRGAFVYPGFSRS